MPDNENEVKSPEVKAESQVKKAEDETSRDTVQVKVYSPFKIYFDGL